MKTQLNQQGIVLKEIMRRQNLFRKNYSQPKTIKITASKTNNHLAKAWHHIRKIKEILKSGVKPSNPY